MIIKVDNFDIKQIADSGQCFRINRTVNGKYRAIAYGKCIDIKQLDNNTIDVDCSEEDWEIIWKGYFDINYDYDKIVETLKNGNDNFLKQAVEYGSGIRILKQEPFETLISFIISQRKNIPAIKTCVELICEKYGERKFNGRIYYNTFPTPECLASADINDLRELGLGYRDEYVKRAAIDVVKGNINLEELKQYHYGYAINELMKLYGVGIKVASCVALFGLHHIEAFPIDVWIRRIIDDYYNGYFNTKPYEGYAGIVQQYVYYIINNK
jgi:N-glycosylase/DNA lyase